MLYFKQILIVLISTIYIANCRYYSNEYESRPTPVAILMHRQALGQDGTFNYAFAADNGLQQGESISADGSRSGAYSYIDPNGETISVKYTAGPEGFQVYGDHIPKPDISVVHE